MKVLSHFAALIRARRERKQGKTMTDDQAHDATEQPATDADIASADAAAPNPNNQPDSRDQRIADLTANLDAVDKRISERDVFLKNMTEELEALKETASRYATSEQAVIQTERNRILDGLKPVLGATTAVMREVTTVIDVGFNDES